MASSRSEIMANVQRYHHQLTVGCGYPQCSNRYCASREDTTAYDATEAVLESLRLVQSGSGDHRCQFEQPPAPPEGTRSLQVDEALKLVETGSTRETIRAVYDTFSCVDSLNLSFLAALPEPVSHPSNALPYGGLPRRLLPNLHPSGLDLEGLNGLYKAWEKTPEGVLGSMQNALKGLVTRLEMVARNFVHPVQLRIFLILFLNPLMMDPENQSDIARNALTAMAALSDPLKGVLKHWFIRLPRSMFKTCLNATQQYITLVLLSYMSITDGVRVALKVMTLLYEANEEAHHVSFVEFYNDVVNQDVDLRMDYAQWQEQGAFSFCNYPFILDPQSKSRIMQCEYMENASQELLHSIVGLGGGPFLIVKVRRSHLLQDAVTQIGRQMRNLRKPLKVVFAGEPGVDAGGVQKEFFQLIVRELFDPQYGMFTYDEETRTYWFNASSMEVDEFRLVGAILGLAIYNGVILDVHFPMVVYKKLLGVEPSLDDLKEAMPSLGSGLQQLLDFEGDVESVFARMFQISYDHFGEVQTLDLKSDGANIPVTNENREEYVRLYVDHILNKSVVSQFDAFRSGFMLCLQGKGLSLVRPQEIELLICGNPYLDFEELERVTHYEDGYTEESTTVLHFWEVIHALTMEEQKRFLFFATGSDRAPPRGLGTMQFTISRAGPDSDRLPSAHTCFNHFLLPDYQCKEKLRRLLVMAIENAEGFGLI